MRLTARDLRTRPNTPAQQHPLSKTILFRSCHLVDIGILECLLKAPKQNQKGHQLRLLEDLETLAGTALASGSQDPLNSKMALAIQMMPCEQARCKLKTNQLNFVENTPPIPQEYYFKQTIEPHATPSKIKTLSPLQRLGCKQFSFPAVIVRSSSNFTSRRWNTVSSVFNIGHS